MPELSAEIRRILALPADIEALRVEAGSDGFRFLAKLVKEWQSEANRFDGPGEVLAGVFDDERLVAVCGLNIDPYAADSTVGRLRHLYVLKSARRKGVASILVRYLIDAARISFINVRLFTDTRDAAIFYEKFGFSPSESATASHTLRLR